MFYGQSFLQGNLMMQSTCSPHNGPPRLPGSLQRLNINLLRLYYGLGFLLSLDMPTHGLIFL